MDDEGQLVEALPKLEVFAPARVTRNPKQPVTKNPQQQLTEDLQRHASENPQQILDPYQSPSVSSPAVGSELEFQLSDRQSWEQNRTLLSAIMTLPSWLVSFIVHLVLLLVLATCTYVASNDGTIFLELAQTADLGEPAVMEIALDEPVVSLDEPFEALESNEVIEPELPVSLPELYETADAFVAIEQPDFEPVVVERPEPPEKTAEETSEATNFFGTRSYGSDFVFVIDCSHSMSVEYRWDRAVSELVATLDQLDSKQKFLVLLYNDKNYTMFGAPDSQKLIPATTENKRRIRNWLGDATPFSGTRPAKSVRLALKKKPDAIYFLSDGELRDNTMFGLRKWNEPRKGPDGNKRLTPIHTILLGSNFGLVTMRTIAKENNGIFTHVR